MERYRVVIVIPAFNEESTITQVVSSAILYGDVIVVNDASTDQTKRFAEDAGAIVVSHAQNQGYDSALNSGFKQAINLNFDAVITFDADGQHEPRMIKEYINNLKNGVDLVLGVRQKSARVSEWLFKVYANYRFNIKDPLCGMKGYRMNLYRHLGHFDSCKSIGTELAIYSIKNNCSICQIDIPIIDRADNPRFGSVVLSNYRIFKALYRVIKLYEFKT